MSTRFKTALALSPTIHNGMVACVMGVSDGYIDPETKRVYPARVDLLFTNSDLISVTLPQFDSEMIAKALVGRLATVFVREQPFGSSLGGGTDIRVQLQAIQGNHSPE